MPVELEFDYIQATAAMDKFSQDDINELRSWTEKLDKSKYVPKDLSDKQLVLFYNACYGELEKTKTCIEKYYSCRKNAPEFFENRVLTTEEMKKATEVLEFSYFPSKSVEGYDILFHRLHDTEPSNYSLENGVKLMFMALDACLSQRGPQPGIIFLFDMRGVKFGHLTRVSLSSLRKFFQYVQEALPVRMKAIHVLNTEPVLDKLLLLIRPFMEKKFYDMLKFHNKNDDLEKFYSGVISRAALPAEFGGALPSTQELHRSCMDAVRDMHAVFKAEEAQRLAALPDKKRDKAMERAFKNLDID